MFIWLSTRATRKIEINFLFDKSRKTIKMRQRYYNFEKQKKKEKNQKPMSERRSQQIRGFSMSHFFFPWIVNNFILKSAEENPHHRNS
jgi:hypothetical protein